MYQSKKCKRKKKCQGLKVRSDINLYVITGVI